MIEVLAEPVGMMLMAITVLWYGLRYGGRPTAGKQA